MLWGGAAYNNGILPFKNYILGEGYTRDGTGALLKNPTPVTEEMKAAGILESLAPLPAWETIPLEIFLGSSKEVEEISLTYFPKSGCQIH